MTLSDPDAPHLLREQRGQTLWLTIAREERRNALSPAVVEGLTQAIAAAQHERSVRAIVITGAGHKAFCAGADLQSGKAFQFDYSQPSQAFANLQLGEVVLLQSGLLYGAGRDRDGLQLELGATSGIPLGGDDLLGVGLSASWANRNYRSSYFGVTAADQASSGLRAYALGAGLLDTNLTLSAEHKLGADWQIGRAHV